jgi:hypothetical protein
VPPFHELEILQLDALAPAEHVQTPLELHDLLLDIVPDDQVHVRPHSLIAGKSPMNNGQMNNAMTVLFMTFPCVKKPPNGGRGVKTIIKVK